MTLGANLKEVESELSQIRKSHSTLEVVSHISRQSSKAQIYKLTNRQLKERLKVAEDEKARLSVRYLKERESFKIKMAEVTTCDS